MMKALRILAASAFGAMLGVTVALPMELLGAPSVLAWSVIIGTGYIMGKIAA